MLKHAKGALASITPHFVKQFLRRRKMERARLANTGRPVQEIFREIYLENKWGGRKGELISGAGSNDRYAREYGGAVRRFVKENGISSLVDLGCGDFVVGAQIIQTGLAYTGVDIVPEVVDRNRTRHAAENVSFECRNIIDDQLPDAELCLVRQVFQHLSNAQISLVLPKLRKYKYVLVTEHYPPEANSVPNVDKPCGADTRTYDNSGVYLDRPPFNFGSPELLLDVAVERGLAGPGERLRTYLFRHR